MTHELKNLSTSEPGVYKFLKYHSFPLLVNQILLGVFSSIWKNFGEIVEFCGKSLKKDDNNSLLTSSYSVISSNSSIPKSGLILKIMHPCIRLTDKDIKMTFFPQISFFSRIKHFEMERNSK